MGNNEALEGDAGMTTIDDIPFDLGRFVTAQEGAYAQAVEELDRKSVV